MGLVEGAYWASWFTAYLPPLLGCALVTALSAAGTGIPLFSNCDFGVLALGLFMLYATPLNGVWRWTYALSIIAGLYLNVFMGITQAFERIEVLHRYAPKGTEPPLIAAQVIVLLAFLFVGFIAASRFRSTGP